MTGPHWGSLAYNSWWPGPKDLSTDPPFGSRYHKKLPSMQILATPLLVLETRSSAIADTARVNDEISDSGRSANHITVILNITL